MRKKMKHTPGPWTVAKYFNDVLDAKGRVLAVVTGWHGEAGNAALIASAPELLEALEELLHCGLLMSKDKGFAPVESAKEAAIAAIAKARGGYE